MPVSASAIAPCWPIGPWGSSAASAPPATASPSRGWWPICSRRHEPPVPTAAPRSARGRGGPGEVADRPQQCRLAGAGSGPPGAAADRPCPLRAQGGRSGPPADVPLPLRRGAGSGAQPAGPGGAGAFRAGAGADGAAGPAPAGPAGPALRRRPGSLGAPRRAGAHARQLPGGRPDRGPQPRADGPARRPAARTWSCEPSTAICWPARPAISASTGCSASVAGPGRWWPAGSPNWPHRGGGDPRQPPRTSPGCTAEARVPPAAPFSRRPPAAPPAGESALRSDRR